MAHFRIIYWSPLWYTYCWLLSVLICTQTFKYLCILWNEERGGWYVNKTRLVRSKVLRLCDNNVTMHLFFSTHLKFSIYKSLKGLQVWLNGSPHMLMAPDSIPSMIYTKIKKKKLLKYICLNLAIWQNKPATFNLLGYNVYSAELNSSQYLKPSHIHVNGQKPLFPSLFALVFETASLVCLCWPPICLPSARSITYAIIPNIWTDPIVEDYTITSITHLNPVPWDVGLSTFD